MILASFSPQAGDAGRHVGNKQTDAVPPITRKGYQTEEETKLEQRLIAGDRQALPDLHALLQARFTPRAARLVQTYRHLLPAYLEAQDLVQEANLTVYKRLPEAMAKVFPLAYLIAVGYQTIRNRCFDAIKEPNSVSLDRPWFEGDETPLHEYLPALLSLPAHEGMNEAKYAPLHDAMAHLPEDQRSVLCALVGWYQHPSTGMRELARQLGKSTGYVLRRERLARTALYFRLKRSYPQYVEHALASQSSQMQSWQRLEQACSQMQALGRPISVQALVKATGVHHEYVMAFLQEREGTRRLPAHEEAWQRLERAYAELQAQSKKISVSALARQAGSQDETAKRYLLEREGAPRLSARQRLERAYAEQQAQGQSISVGTLARCAGTSWASASKYLQAKEVQA